MSPFLYDVTTYIVLTYALSPNSYSTTVNNAFCCILLSNDDTAKGDNLMLLPGVICQDQ